MEETFEPTALFVHPEELKAAEREAYAKAGLVKVNRANETVPDTDAMKERVYQTVTTHVVNERAEMGTRSLTQGELYAKVFPGAPGSDPNHVVAELSLLDQAVRAKLRRAVWTLMGPGRKGYVQNRLGKEGRSEVLIRTKVQRGVDEIVGVFITDHTDLILQESVHPVIEKLLGAAREVRLYNELIIDGRHPELIPQVTKMLDTAKKRVAAELTRTASNGSTPALKAGSTDPSRSDASLAE